MKGFVYKSMRMRKKVRFNIVLMDKDGDIEIDKLTCSKVNEDEV